MASSTFKSRFRNDDWDESGSADFAFMDTRVNDFGNDEKAPDPKDIVKKHKGLFGLNERSLAEELRGYVDKDKELVTGVFALLSEKEKNKTAGFMAAGWTKTGLEKLSDSDLEWQRDNILVHSDSEESKQCKKWISEILQKRAEEREAEKKRLEEEERKRKEKEARDIAEALAKKKADFEERFTKHQIVKSDFTDTDLKPIIDKKFADMPTADLRAYQESSELTDPGAKFEVGMLVFKRYVDEVDKVSTVGETETDKKFKVKDTGNGKKYYIVGADNTEKEVTEAAFNKSKADFIKNDVPKLETKYRVEKAWQLSEWARKQAYSIDIAGYLGRTNLSDAAKQVTLQKIFAELARIEFLLGTIYYGGKDKDWESSNLEINPVTNTSSSTSRRFVNLYQKEVTGAVQSGENGEWCAMFGGYVYKMMGLDPALTAGRTNILPQFSSVSKLRFWATQGKVNIGNTWPVVVESDKLVNQNKGGNYFISASEWDQLSTDLDANEKLKDPPKTNKTKGKNENTGNEPAQTYKPPVQIVNDFFSTRVVPQPGDMLGRSNEGHEAYVESYDAATGTIYTIEGNTSDRVRGEKIDLTNSANPKLIAYLIRMGPSWFKGYVAQDAQLPEMAKEQQDELQNGLVNPLKDIVSQLVALASGHGWLPESDPTKKVNELGQYSGAPSND